jgi:transposase
MKLDVYKIEIQHPKTCLLSECHWSDREGCGGVQLSPVKDKLQLLRCKMTKCTNKQYPNDFKQEAVALVTQQGYSVVEVAVSLNITDKLLDNWVTKFKQESENSVLSTYECVELI